jgi:hypothetical protein
MRLTRFEIVDLARRAHAMAQGASDPSERSQQWLESYRRFRGELIAQVRDVDLLNRFAEMADGDYDTESGTDIEWLLARLDGDARCLARGHRVALGQVGAALDFISAQQCGFASGQPPVETLPAFVRAVLAVAEQNRVRLPELSKLKPDFGGAAWAPHACAMVDLGLAQTAYGYEMHIYPERCRYWLEENDPMRNKRGDIVHGDKIEIRTGVNVARGASAHGVTVQDNSHGGSGSVDASQANFSAFFNQLVSTVNQRDDAPDGDLEVAVEAKALAKAGNTAGALAALKKGTGWLLGIATEIATQVGVQVALDKFGLK